MQQVISSNISGVDYDPLQKRLTVQFKNGGTYDYFGISPEINTAFMQSDSKGSFLHKAIKPLASKVIKVK